MAVAIGPYCSDIHRAPISVIGIIAASPWRTGTANAATPSHNPATLLESNLAAMQRIAAILFIFCFDCYNRASMLRPRISLLTALLLTTIVGLTIVVALFWREIGPLRTEVRLLRNETGRLLVEDVDDIYAVALRPLAPGETGAWSWRVYLPPGQSYRVRAGVAPKLDKLPIPTVAVGDMESLLEPGEHVLRIDLQNTPDEAWRLRYSQEPAGVADGPRWLMTHDVLLPWPTQWPGYRAGYGFSGVLGDAQKQFAASKQVLLLRLVPNFMPDNQSGRNPEDNKSLRVATKPPTEVFYLWIEPASAAATK